MGRRRRRALAPVGDAMKRIALGSLAALALLGALACEPPPPCPDCPRTPPAVPVDAGPPDVGHSSPPVPRDGGQDWPDAGLECSGEDLEAWAAFFRRLDFVHVVTTCTAEPECGGRRCSPVECTAALGPRPGCAATPWFECLAHHCASACGASGSAESCRYCGCTSDCFGDLAICSACDSRVQGCAPFALRPELVWLIGR